MRGLKYVLASLLLVAGVPLVHGDDCELACPPHPGPHPPWGQYGVLTGYVLFSLTVEVPWTLPWSFVNIGKAAANGCGVLGTLEGFADGVGDVVGHTEKIGPPYPVDPYQCKVSHDLWRGSRIGDEARVRQLHASGIRSIVNLIWEKSSPDEEQEWSEHNGLHYLPLPIVDSQVPNSEEVTRFLHFVTDEQNWPAYVHCEAGSGRTGVMVAAYRMAIEGWSPEGAIVEARKFGLSAPAQVCFLKNLGTDLAAGRIAGYPQRQLGCPLPEPSCPASVP